MPKTAAVRLPLLVASALLLALPACGKTGNTAANNKDKAKQERTVSVKIGGAAAPNAVTANVAEFDPNADVTVDLNGGSERPDEYAIQQAFFGQFGAIDECVWSYKDNERLDEQLPGDVALAVKLNPTQSRPYGVNATMPEGFEEAAKLKDCLREAAAGAPYPTYDGPPVVVDFEFELDPGYVEE